MNLDNITFQDSNGSEVPYDGSPITWRVSAYSLITKDGQVLLIRGQDEELFDVVGGSIDIGESVKESLKREALEEAGAIIQIGELLTYHQDYFYHRSEKRFYQTMLLYFRSKQMGELASPQDPKIQFS